MALNPHFEVGGNFNSSCSLDRFYLLFVLATYFSSKMSITSKSLVVNSPDFEKKSINSQNLKRNQGDSSINGRR